MDGPPETQSPPEVGASEGLKGQSGRHQLGHKDTTRSADDYARERYRLDGQIKRILRADAKKRAPEKFPGDVYRTIDCTWCRVADLSMVRPADRDSYHYKGLATCGSLYTCPICASKIQERRRQEVEQAIAWATAQERAGYVVSLTFPHRIDQPLSELLKMQRDALQHMRNSRGYKQLMERCKHAGRIRSLEVTHGQNGWHPHTHELLFLDPEVPAEWLKWQLVWLWLKSCRKVGLFRDDRDNEADFCRYSVDVRAGDEGTADYLAKMDDQRQWGLSHELTKSSSKQGRRAGSHPFKLASEPATHGLFLEYVHAMKGSRQLIWSRGLKEAVGVVDKSDVEIAQEDVAKVSDQIPVADRAWRFVLGNDARWELTNEAKLGGAPAVAEFLMSLGYQENGNDGLHHGGRAAARGSEVPGRGRVPGCGRAHGAAGRCAGAVGGPADALGAGSEPGCDAPLLGPVRDAPRLQAPGRSGPPPR